MGGLRDARTRWSDKRWAGAGVCGHWGRAKEIGRRGQAAVGACRGLLVSQAYWVGSGLSFYRPLLLLVLLVVPAGVCGCWWAQRRRVRHALRFTNLELLAAVAGGVGWPAAAAGAVVSTLVCLGVVCACSPLPAEAGYRSRARA